MSEQLELHTVTEEHDAAYAEVVSHLRAAVRAAQKVKCLAQDCDCEACHWVREGLLYATEVALGELTSFLPGTVAR
jgi:hypothetical protein